METIRRDHDVAVRFYNFINYQGVTASQQVVNSWAREIASLLTFVMEGEQLDRALQAVENKRLKMLIEHEY